METVTKEYLVAGWLGCGVQPMHSLRVAGCLLE